MKSLRIIILATASFLPVIVLGSLAIHYRFITSAGRDIILPVKGYDPRDLFAGHYLTFRVDYPVEDLCKSYDKSLRNEKMIIYESCICYDIDDNGRMMDASIIDQCNQYELEQCKNYLRGECRAGFFNAGIERFYLNERLAPKMDSRLRKGENVSIRVSVDEKGNGIVKDLFFE